MTNLDSSSQRSTPSGELVNDSQSEQLYRERVEALAQAMLVRHLEQLIAQIHYVRVTVEVIAQEPSTLKRMQSLLLRKLELAQMELSYIAPMLHAKNVPNLSSMLESDGSYSDPYIGPGSARPFSGKQE